MFICVCFDTYQTSFRECDCFRHNKLPTFSSGIIQVKCLQWRYVWYHRKVHEAFVAGKFVVQRCDKKSSLMALDQSQEHSIQFLKEDRGAKSLYWQLRVIELSKPEVLRAIDEYECACFSASTPNESLEHPESVISC